MLIVINEILWNKFLIFLLLGTSIFFTFKLKFVQITKIFKAFSLKETTSSKTLISPYKTLITSVSAKVGVGNIAGAATAIVLGGPSSIFWMWVSGFFSMATSYLEGYYAVKLRKIRNGYIEGGPHFYIKIAFKGGFGKFLALIFSLLVIITMGFVGTIVQSNTIANAFENAFSVNPLSVGILLSIICYFIFKGGIFRISSILEKFAPTVAILYIFCCIFIIFMNKENIKSVFSEIFSGVFQNASITGGIFGSFTKEAMRYGIARGLFSNESGLGSSPHIYALSSIKDPQKQGALAMLAVFIDTFVILSLTAFAILTAFGSHINILKTTETSISLTQLAFSKNFNHSFIILSVFIFFFALSSILGWYFYGEQNFIYIFGKKHLKVYTFSVLFFIILGSFTDVDFAWQLADFFNGLITIPNILSLLILSLSKKTKPI